MESQKLALFFAKHKLDDIEQIVVRADQVADVEGVIEPPHSKLVKDVVLLTLSAPDTLSTAFATDQAAPARVKHGLALA